MSVRLCNRVALAVRRASRRCGAHVRVVAQNGASVAVDAAFVPAGDSAANVAEGSLGLRGRWVFALDDWRRVERVVGDSDQFVVRNGESVWRPDFGQPVVKEPEAGVVSVAVCRVDSVR